MVSYPRESLSEFVVHTLSPFFSILCSIADSMVRIRDSALTPTLKTYISLAFRDKKLT